MDYRHVEKSCFPADAWADENAKAYSIAQGLPRSSIELLCPDEGYAVLMFTDASEEVNISRADTVG